MYPVSNSTAESSSIYRPPTSLAGSILLVDDHRLFRHGLKMIIEQQTSMVVAAEAENGAKAIELAEKLSPDIILLDLHLPDILGIEVVRKILDQRPDARIIVLSSDADPRLVDAAIHAGVMGYLLKENAPEELIRALQTVMGGLMFFCPEVNTIVLSSMRPSSGIRGSDVAKKLSVQEKEVLRYIAQGLRTKEIAVQLNISVKTAETYRLRLMKKLNLFSVAELTRYAIREGIASP